MKEKSSRKIGQIVSLAMAALKEDQDRLAECNLLTKALASDNRIIRMLVNFNKEYADCLVNHFKPLDMETYQEQREKDGFAPATIDMEIQRVGSMIRKAFDNDKINGEALKVFKRVRPKLKKGSNSRKRLLSPGEYLIIPNNSRPHLKPMITVAYNTGMRRFPECQTKL
ncbi:MAG: hypothetical protein JW932_09915 [Deltaproteobacteria bacterium]|nr:hypothetical protein [Deltaproteobacteria bacterium]